MRFTSRFLFWSTVLVASLIVSGLSLRFMAVSGLPLSKSLIIRGVSCLAVVLIFAAQWKSSLVPKFPRTQFFRALLAGLALTFFTMSYQWLTASTISTLSNIDVPLLIALGPLVGLRASWKVRAVALVSISFLIWFVTGLELQLNLFYGLGSLLLGTLLLCFGYLFIKKSMAEESEAVTILVPSLALIFYGLLQYKMEAPGWSVVLLTVGFLSGLSMFSAYYATMRLYEESDIASAEFPTLLSSIFIQPVEAIFLDSPLRTVYLLPSIGFVLTIYFLLHWQAKQNALP